MAVAGKVMPRPRGPYDPAAVYQILDMVTLNNKLWVAKVSDMQGVDPAADDGTKWMMAVDGTTDVKGLEAMVIEKFAEIDAAFAEDDQAIATNTANIATNANNISSHASKLASHDSTLADHNNRINNHGRHIPDACQQISDWNAVVTNGWYMASNAANAPETGWFFGIVTVHNGQYLLQELTRLDTSNNAADVSRYRRHRVGGAWGFWVKLNNVVQTVTVNAGSWTGSAAPFSNNVGVSGVTAANIVDISIPGNATVAQVQAYMDAKIMNATQGANVITLKAWGDKPTINLPLTVVIRGG